jgi:hypothetical protein
MRESGQATVEWIGLVLALALAFAGALMITGGARFDAPAHGLGEAVSGRMVCAVRGTCARRSLARRPPAARTPAPRLPAVRPPSLRYLARGVRPARPRASAPRAGRRLLRAFARAGEHAWIVCFGVRRLRQELDHPQSPRQTLSKRDALDIFNECLNPLGFLLP